MNTKTLNLLWDIGIVLNAMYTGHILTLIFNGGF